MAQAAAFQRHVFDQPQIALHIWSHLQRSACPAIESEAIEAIEARTSRKLVMTVLPVLVFPSPLPFLATNGQKAEC